jgi:hypothetical protein
VERRKYSRYFVNLQIEITEAGSSFPVRSTTIDVSLNGCYVATIFPLTVGSQVYFTLWVADEKVSGRGAVKTCHRGVGMGIQFVDFAGEDRLRLDVYLRAFAPSSPERIFQSYFR